MRIDTTHERFMLPEDKAHDLIQTTDIIIHSAQISNRLLARMAGKMVAASPAIQLSKMFAGVLSRETGWDAVYPSAKATGLFQGNNGSLHWGQLVEEGSDTACGG